MKQSLPSSCTIRAFSTVWYQLRIASKFDVRTTKCANSAGAIASGFTGSRGRRVMSGVASMLVPPVASHVIADGRR